MPNIEIEANGRFSTELKRKVEEHGMSLTDLAKKVDSTYEHMRKLVGGRAYPSTHLLRAMAVALHADGEEWAEMVEADKLFKKYKKLPKFLGLSAKLKPFEAIVPKLSDQSCKILLETAKTLARNETAHK